MNRQLQIHVLSDDSIQLDDLILSKQYVDGSPYTITTAELTVYDVDTIIASGTLSSGLSYQDSENNSLVYSWSTAEVATLTENPKSNYRAVWRLNLTADVADREVIRFFDVVYWLLLNPITEIDIVNENPALKDARQTETHKVTTSIDNISFICNELSDVSGFWDGSTIEFTSINNKNVQVKIESWDDQTNIITLVETLPVVPATKDRFILKRSFKQEINSAWDEILSTVNSWRPALTDITGLNKTVDSYDLKLLHLYKTVAAVAAAAMRSDDDAYSLILRRYNEKASVEFTKLEIKVDEDNSGDYDNEADGERSGQVWAKQ